LAKVTDVGLIYNVHPKEGEVLEREGILSSLLERGFSVKKVNGCHPLEHNLDVLSHRIEVARSLFPNEKYIFDCHVSWLRFPEILLNGSFAEKLNFNPSLWIFPSPKLFPYFFSGWNLPVPQDFITLEFVPLNSAREVRQIGREQYLKVLLDELASFVDVLP
jgi:hypothetical protein